MLAYDLFSQNKNSNDNVVKTVFPIKKIYATKEGFKVDNKTLEEYGNKLRAKTRPMQEYLLMPLNNSDAQRLNLPIASLAPNAPKPYVEIFGNLRIKKSGKKLEPMIELKISGKDSSGDNKTFRSEISVNDGKIDHIGDGEIKLRLDNRNYRIGNQNLYDVYVNLEVIKPNGNFTSSTFRKICAEFLNFVNSRKNNLEPNLKQISFRIYVIPGEDRISFMKEENTVVGSDYVDAFGVRDSSFSSKTTKTAQFLSSDDPAFTINCKERSEFYKNLGISSKSLEKINIPTDSFNISGLSWLFAIIDDPKFKFEETGKGVYLQIFRNFQMLDKRFEDDPKYQAQMKIMCFKRNQAKLEILIDENMTMDRMRRIFRNVKEPEIPLLAFEVLIEKTKQSIIWNYYLTAVRSLIIGRAMSRDQLLSYITMRVRRNVHTWVKDGDDEAAYFFTKTAFCRLSK